MALAHVPWHMPLALAHWRWANASAQATRGSQVTSGKSDDFLAPTALIFLRSQRWLPFLLFFSFFLSFRFSVNQNINSALPDSFCASHNSWLMKYSLWNWMDSLKSWLFMAQMCGLVCGFEDRRSGSGRSSKILRNEFCCSLIAQETQTAGGLPKGALRNEAWYLLRKGNLISGHSMSVMISRTSARLGGTI